MFTAAEMNRIANGYYEGTCVVDNLETVATEIFEAAYYGEKYLQFDYDSAFFDEGMDADENDMAMEDVRTMVQVLRNHGFDVKWNSDKTITVRW